MKNKFAKRVKNTPRSFTRKILDLTQQSSVISFAGGLPDESLFPHVVIKKEIITILDNSSNSIYQYSPASGSPSLREEIAKNYKSKNDDEVLITNGSQQGLDLICKAFIDSGDVIVVESPSYLAALNLFSLYDPSIIEVELSHSGVDLKKLEDIFKTENPKFFYTIPTFQNPTCWSWEQECKVKVAALAKKYSVIIIEDSPYNEIRYEGVESISFDELLPDQTVSLGTFSKTLVPDFRIGWMKSNIKFITAFRGLKENTDLQSSRFFQNVVANMLRDGQLSLHVKTLINKYKEKRDLMAQSLKSDFKDEVEFETPQGGMFFWIKFKENIDTMDLFDFAIKENVAFVPGIVFFKNNNENSYARVNFTNASLSEIEEGIKRLKLAYDNYIRE